MNHKYLYISLCEDAYQTDKDGKRHKGRKPNPLACAECESICEWGIELLKSIDEQEYQELLCGADCETCRQPCNLRRITWMRGIRWTNRKIQKNWTCVAMRPYLEEKRRNER